MVAAAIAPHRILCRRMVAGLRVTHFAQAPKTVMSRRYHGNATLCVLLRGQARDRFGSRIVEYQPGTVVYLPPGERHTHEFGKDGMVGLVLEVATVRPWNCLQEECFSEARYGIDALALTDSARLINLLRDPTVEQMELEENCLALFSALSRNRYAASRGSEGVSRVRALLD